MSIISIKEIGVSKNKQIINSIEVAIINKTLKKGDKLPSINSIRDKFSISRDTVLNAYNELKMRGIIQSVVGKGYYLIKENISTSKKIFLLFDEFNAFKEDLYNAFISNLDARVEVDIFFHHFNYDVFRNTILNNTGNYSYYVIMPANLKNTGAIVEHLPQDKVYILDQMHDDLMKFPAVYQNFEKGVFECLEKLKLQILNYSKLILFFNTAKQPVSILKGFELFCAKNNIPFEVLESIKNIAIQKGCAYMTLEDSSLISIIKQAKVKKLKVIDDIGIISYNDTSLKEIVGEGITVISTDFSEMGKKLAKMITDNSKQRIENEITLTLRKSI